MTQILEDQISLLAQKDVLELHTKIKRFRSGEIPEEKFKAFRLTRGVYGQRQLGVQMLRIKLPYGKVTGAQLNRIADIADQYTNGNLHATTRQNIQLHHIHLDDTPEIWEKLEQKNITLRESCGNTVRNITASAAAGIDKDELFDVTPYAEAVFQFFLRNPICQDMGRKIKMSFSSSDSDSAFSYIHDFGFIPRIQDGERGFKVVIGGGLGAQTFIAQTAAEFLPTDQLIPFIEAGLRVFDRYGERERRHKARLKFLVDEKGGIGLEKFLEYLSIERKSGSISVPVDTTLPNEAAIPKEIDAPSVEIHDTEKYEKWRAINVSEQKQKGFYSVKIALKLGNISSDKARELVKVISGYVADDIRVTVGQGLLLRFAREQHLPYLFYVLNHLELAEPITDTIADITACPGTDTCNLGVTNSTTIAEELKQVLINNFPNLIADSDIRIKISGCMNSCGQHMIAHIGFHGSSIKSNGLIVPALQVVLGGGVDVNGRGFMADKVIKLPTKKIPQALSALLRDYEEFAIEGEYFNDYYRRQGKIYFYDLLKPFADLDKLIPTDFQDWGESQNFVPAIGTGECAGVSYDLVETVIADAEERLHHAGENLEKRSYHDSLYHNYSAFAILAKALLLSKDVHCNTHIGIINDFDAHFGQNTTFNFQGSFSETVLAINQQTPTEAFAKKYNAQAKDFYNKVRAFRTQQVAEQAELKDKNVISNFYKG